MYTQLLFGLVHCVGAVFASGFLGTILFRKNPAVRAAVGRVLRATQRSPIKNVFRIFVSMI
jgi:hypothetical protein